MSEPGSPFPPDRQPELPARPAATQTALQKVSLGAAGLRAGWRLLLFAAIVVALFGTEGMILRVAMHGGSPRISLTPEPLLIAEGTSFAVIFVASLIMAALEKRRIGDYGLPLGRAFRTDFWWGIAFGFGSITVLLGALWAARVFHSDGVALHGGDLWRYGLLWAGVFLLVGGFEEFGFRGYALFTLSDGIGFWAAAIFLSICFGYAHHNNSGETWLGAFSAGEIGLVLCLMLRRSGSLWLPIGFHAAWDWGETFFYGVSDSGLVATGHFLNTHLAGPEWLTGGSVGPEASWFCIVLVALIGILTHLCLPVARYPQRRGEQVTQDRELQPVESAQTNTGT